MAATPYDSGLIIEGFPFILFFKKINFLSKNMAWKFGRSYIYGMRGFYLVVVFGKFFCVLRRKRKKEKKW